MIEWYTRPLQLQPGLGPQPRPVQPRLAIVDVPLDGPGVDLQAPRVSTRLTPSPGRKSLMPKSGEGTRTRTCGVERTGNRGCVLTCCGPSAFTSFAPSSLMHVSVSAFRTVCRVNVSRKTKGGKGATATAVAYQQANTYSRTRAQHPPDLRRRDQRGQRAPDQRPWHRGTAP